MSYEAAILETDFARLPDRIEAGQTAINSRIKQLEKESKWGWRGEAGDSADLVRIS